MTTDLTWRKAEAGHYFAEDAQGIFRVNVVRGDHPRFRNTYNNGLKSEWWALHADGEPTCHTTMRAAKNAAEVNYSARQAIVRGDALLAATDTSDQVDDTSDLPTCERCGTVDNVGPSHRGNVTHWTCDEHTRLDETTSDTSDLPGTVGMGDAVSTCPTHGRQVFTRDAFDRQVCEVCLAVHGTSDLPGRQFTRDDLPTRGDYTWRSREAHEARQTRNLPPVPTRQRVPRPLHQVTSDGPRRGRWNATLTHRPFAGLKSQLTAARNAAEYEARQVTR